MYAEAHTLAKCASFFVIPPPPPPPPASRAPRPLDTAGGRGGAAAAALIDTNKPPTLASTPSPNQPHRPSPLFPHTHTHHLAPARSSPSWCGTRPFAHLLLPFSLCCTLLPPISAAERRRPRKQQPNPHLIQQPPPRPTKRGPGKAPAPLKTPQTHTPHNTAPLFNTIRTPLSKQRGGARRGFSPLPFCPPFSLSATFLISRAPLCAPLFINCWILGTAIRHTPHSY